MRTQNRCKQQAQQDENAIQTITCSEERERVGNMPAGRTRNIEGTNDVYSVVRK